MSMCFVKQKTAYEMRISDWSSDVCSSDLALNSRDLGDPQVARAVQANAATSAIHQFAKKDALRRLGTNYFVGGEAGEKRSEERRVGNAWGSTCRSRWSPDP